MKRDFVFAILICLLAGTSCQRGIYWDIASQGALSKDSSGNCMPVSVNGSFTVNKPINDSNFLIVTANVTTMGDYAITSDNINGYFFNAKGSFNQTGNVDVKMLCTGMPLVAGTDKFSIKYNGSICEAFVTVSADTIPAAVYTLQDSSGTCMGNIVKGSYIQNVALDTSDKVSITVNVTTPGTYSISTDKINGYSFKTTGVFTQAGVQPVLLSGSGTPVLNGDDFFTVTADTHICIFSVHVVQAVVVANPHYFPLTAGSFWTYFNPVHKDTVKRYINGDTTINTTVFIRMSESEKTKQQTYFYNFNGNDYNEFSKVDRYNSSFYYDPPIYGLLPFLKESLNKGDSWESDEFKGTASFGQVLYFKYHYHCSNVGLSVSVNGFGFKNVYLVEVHPMVKSEVGAYGATNEVFYMYYAKGIGLVYEEVSMVGSDPYPLLGITDWLVN